MASLDDNAAFYEEMQQKLASANASLEASEVHGVLCGLAAIDRPMPGNWFAELFDQAEPGDVLVDEAQSLVRELFDFTLQQIGNNETGIHLLMPADEVSLPLRARALAEWSQGFLYGVGLAGDEQQFSEQARECLEDITEFTRMDLNAIGEDDDPSEEEQAVMELTEFLRVAILLIHEDIKASQVEEDAHNNEYH